MDIIGLYWTLLDMGLAERVGFEPTDRKRSLDFESSTFDHSVTSPKLKFHVNPRSEKFKKMKLIHETWYCTLRSEIHNLRIFPLFFYLNLIIREIF